MGEKQAELSVAPELLTQVDLRGRVVTGAANIAAALRHDASSIVVGAHRFLGQHECDLGFTATHVLRHSPVPVTMCYDPIR